MRKKSLKILFLNQITKIKFKWTEEKDIEENINKPKIEYDIIKPIESKCIIHNKQNVDYSKKGIKSYDIDFQDVEILLVGLNDANLSKKEIKLNCLHSFLLRYFNKIKEDVIKYQNPFISNIFQNEFIRKLKHGIFVKKEYADKINNELKLFKEFMDKYNKSLGI